jgi:hypothetical protein
MNHIQNFGEYSVKKVKNFTGMDTIGFNADLYRGNKKIALAIDDGNGGEVYLQGLSRDEEDKLNTFCKSLPQIDTEYTFKLTVDIGLLVGELVAKFEKERDINKMRKQCLTKTLFRAKIHGYGQYGIFKNVCDDKLRQHIKAKYGDGVEIFNDVFAQGKIPSVFETLEEA